MKLSILIPCYNEELGIKEVIKDIPLSRLKKLGYKTEVIVIDNNSTDNTVKVAEKAGAKVISEKKQGKGHAMVTGFRSVHKDTDIVVMIDGDHSYDIREIFRLIEPIESGFCDVVIGSRLNGKITEGSMTFFNRVGNWFFTFLVRLGYKGNVTDVCSGFFAFNKEVSDRLYPHLMSNGFAIEMEMISKMANMGVEMFSVPISYEERKGHSSLNPIKDGIRIMHTWFKYLYWKEPGKKKKFGKIKSAAKFIYDTIF